MKYVFVLLAGVLLIAAGLFLQPAEAREQRYDNISAGG